MRKWRWRWEWCEEVEVEAEKETLKRTHKNIILLFLYAHWVYI